MTIIKLTLTNYTLLLQSHINNDKHKNIIFLHSKYVFNDKFNPANYDKVKCKIKSEMSKYK